MNREQFAKMPAEELQRRLRNVRDRMTRANTTQAALADMYVEQEIEGGLQMKEEDKRYV